MKRIFYILILLFFGSCLKEEYPQNEFKEQLVVEGFIEQDGVAKVMLSLNMDKSEEISEESLREKIVRYAKLRVTDVDNNDGEDLIGMIDKKYPTQFIYTSSRIRGRVGGTYRLDIEYNGPIESLNGRKWSAETTIPEPNMLYDTKMEHVEGHLYRLTAKIKPNKDGLPYMVRCATAFTEKDEPHYFPPALFGIIESCEKETTITINRALDYSNILEYSTMFLQFEDVYIQFCTMEEFGYKYWSIWENCTLNSLNPVFPVDEVPPTNISGGAAGIWMGYGTSYYRVRPYNLPIAPPKE